MGSHNKKIDEWLSNTRALQTSWCRFNSAPDQSLHRFAEQAPGDFWSFHEPVLLAMDVPLARGNAHHMCSK
jgi:hypothetical protein